MNHKDLLFQPLRLGALNLPHRILMAPLTRARATGRIPNDLMVAYYAQRASAALIISEATAISEQGYRTDDHPSLFDDDGDPR